jgi:hypothetical protein
MPTSGPKGPLFPNTYLAGAAVVRYRVVKRGADLNSVIMAAAATDVPLGISGDNQDTIGRVLRVNDRPGENVVGEAGAAFALDALLTSDANGRLVTCATTNPVAAIARQAAAALSDLVAVEVAPRGMKAP